jgi:hypothetical protein
MHFIATTLTLAIIGTVATAIPADSPLATAIVTQPDPVYCSDSYPIWHIYSFKRVCNDSSCTFDIEVQAASPCHYTIPGNATTAYVNQPCQNYLIGSTYQPGYNGGEGWTTLSVVQNGRIIYPAYKVRHANSTSNSNKY